MKLAATLGFLTGTAISLWAFLRQHSTAEDDPMEQVQTVDPYLWRMTVDCE